MSVKEVKTVALCLLVFSFLMALFTVNRINTYAVNVSNIDSTGATLLNDVTDSLGLVGGISQVVSISIDPFIALAAISIAGNILNSDIIDAGNSIHADRIMNLPLSNTAAMLFLVSIAVLRILLSMFRGSKVLSDALIAKVEYAVGLLAACGISFMGLFAVTAHAADTATVAANPATATAAMTAVSFVVSFLSYIAFATVRLMIKAIEVIGFLFSLFPAAYQIFQLMKYGMVFFYIILSAVSPNIAAVLGAIIVLVAIIIFEKARRLERYFRKIYIKPCFNSIFARKKKLPLVMHKIPVYIRNKFDNIIFCQEAFVIKGVDGVKKRDIVYLVNDGTQTFICHRAFLKKSRIFSFPMGELCGEKRFGYFMICSKEDGIKKSNLEIILRRELNNSYDEIKEICCFKEDEPVKVKKKAKKELQYV